MLDSHAATCDSATEIEAAAVTYAARGWPVVPLWWPAAPACCACPGGAECGSPGKHPYAELAPDGLHDATTDVATVGRWWRENPDLNVGLRTGIAFDVLDLDDPSAGQWLARHAHGLGEDTAECWRWGPLSVTAHGHHLLYAPTGHGNRTRIRDVAGLDWRGRGGYIVAPPSRHHSGHIYAWNPDCAPDAPIPTAPKVLLDLVASRPVRSKPATTGRHRRFTPFAADHSRWSAAGLFEMMARAVEGERNNVLFWCASRIGDDVRNGRVGNARADDALARLGEIAEQRGLPYRDVDRTIRSALRGIDV